MGPPMVHARLPALLGKFWLIFSEIPLNFHDAISRWVQQQVLGQGIFNLVLQIMPNLAGAGAAAQAGQHTSLVTDYR